ncbi:putative bifunctional diguanylate cyclase/phosphodiesterase [Celeribacter persicus]|uniref:Diguanylate cyclase/phosphodiesterase n=1 Tax=Celeribacter persicus TaxID=1651082 RepID=A0A2T5HWR4_9RHOB|nr:EAL domain-containing protein [Celeribacter persicus]PTQ76014.1 diguanylate cyclase/phosphodiesterase [Celeribacter persicus]
MPNDIAAKLHRLRDALTGPQTLAFLPALCLGAFWFGGESLLIACALLVPALATLLSMSDATRHHRPIARDGLTGLPLRRTVTDILDQILDARDTTGRTTACLVIEIDDFHALSSGFGATASDDILISAAQRLRDALRDHDTLARLEGARFAIVFAPVRRADLESLIQLASRLQAALSEPFSINASKIFATASIGFCLPNRAPAASGQAFLDAAEIALADAHRNGPGSIRAYSPAIAARILERSSLNADVGDALENGQILPWFQPQISTDTGTVSGMEALARWVHPEQGALPPAEFMPDIEELGLQERLSEVMLYHALMAIKEWDRAGFHIPSVAVNFSPTDLANPRIVDKIRWELDRFELKPERLSVEVLESVISSSDNDTITRNIWALNEMGCGIDLDDYGTGHASIANIRRFAVKRIKIDRSYVSRCDLDRDQQSMLAAILTMAERLDLETLAEGVETVGEHAMLSQLGCNHVQGYSISRPMAFEQTHEWMETHNRKLTHPPQIGRRAS